MKFRLRSWAAPAHAFVFATEPLHLFTAAVALLLGASQASAADPLKLSGGMQVAGNVTASWLSPDSQYAVFIADRETPGVFDLWSATTAGGAPVKLSGQPLSGTGVDPDGVRITPDSARVVFVAQMGTNTAPALWTVALTGGAPTLLSTGGTGVLANAKLTPDGTRAVYLQPDAVGSSHRLRSVPVAGGAISTLSAAGISSSSTAQTFAVTPDSLTAVFVCACTTPGVAELYRVPVAGGAVTTLSGSLVVSATGVTGFKIAPDGARAVFSGRVDSATRVRLYSVPLAGAATRTTLSGSGANTGPDGEIADPSRYAIAPNSVTVVYVLTFLPQPDIGEDLFSVPITGGSAVLLNTNASLLFGLINDFDITADNLRVVWVGTDPQISTGDRCRGIFMAPIATANARTTLAMDPQNRDAYSVWQMRLTPDGQRAVFTGSLTDPAGATLYSVATGGGAVTSLINGSYVAADTAFNTNAGGDEVMRQQFVLSRDGSRVFYRGAFTQPSTLDDRYAMWSVPLAGGAGLLLSGGYQFSNILSVFGSSRVAPGDVALFRSRRSSADNTELFVSTGTTAARSFVDIDGNGSAAAETDGVLLARWLLGFRNAALTTGALGPGATRNAAQINSYLSGVLGVSGL